MTEPTSHPVAADLEALAAIDAISSAFAAPFEQINYLSHHSRARGYIYIEVPKVACTTIKRVLQDGEPGVSHPIPRDVHDRGISALARPGEDAVWYLSALRAPEIFTFAFVRNPYTRALSCYLDKFVENPSERARLAPELGLPDETPDFGTYLAAVHAQPPEAWEIHWASQTSLIRPDRIAYDYLGRFENFADHFGQVCRTIGVPADGVARGTAHATGAGQRICDYFGPDEISLVRAIYADDFRTFGYGYGLDIV